MKRRFDTDDNPNRDEIGMQFGAAKPATRDGNLQFLGGLTEEPEHAQRWWRMFMRKPKP